jgi:hypothetical protein
VLTPESGLYNGSEYAGYPFSFTDGHPFFESPSPITGSIVYEGILYENVPLQFDMINELIIIRSPDQRYQIQLFNERITGFDLLDHHFIRLIKDSSNSDLISSGFYELLYERGTSVFKKEKKKINENVSATAGVTRTVLINDLFYLKKNGKYYYVKNKGAMMNILEDRKKEIKQFMHKNKLNFKRNTDNTLTQVAQYYDQLNNK